ncbi:hypothetical protein [Silvibacterium acidisoli]|uniref:hypothetical protein n=1 Tax=Acidobacteriaceae bacterium ZG23-2 TaxID=2883246 RepID=UPI00406C3D85
MKGFLRTLALTGIVAAAGAVAAKPADAQVRFGIAVGVPAPVYADNYIPPCPGDGYFWTAGYYNAGIWVPGRWARHDYYAPRGYYGGHYDHQFYGRGYDHGFEGRGGRGFRR